MISSVACSEALGFCYWLLISWVSCYTCLNLQSGNLECWKGRKCLSASHSRERWVVRLRIVARRRHWFRFAVTTGLWIRWHVTCSSPSAHLACYLRMIWLEFSRAGRCGRISRGSFNCEKLTKSNLWPCLFLEKGSRSAVVSPLQSKLEALQQPVLTPLTCPCSVANSAPLC